MDLTHITQLISEGAGAFYLLATFIGHLPFMPPKVVTFCTHAALNIKGLKDAFSK